MTPDLSKFHHLPLPPRFVEYLKCFYWGMNEVETSARMNVNLSTVRGYRRQIRLRSGMLVKTLREEWTRERNRKARRMVEEAVEELVGALVKSADPTAMEVLERWEKRIEEEWGI